MLFDEKIFSVTLRKLISDGDHDAVIAFLLSELRRIEDSDIAVADSCCCGKTTCTLQEEDRAWQHNRLQGQIVLYSELANCYREQRLWDRCFETYDTLEMLLRENDLMDTEAYGSVLLNEAYAHAGHGDSELALQQIGIAEALLEKLENQDCAVWSRLYNLLAVIYRQQNDEERAQQACRKAGEKMQEGAKDENERVDMLLNHAATLMQMGNPEDALRVVEDVIHTCEAAAGQVMPYFAALNLKAMIFCHGGKYLEAAKAFACLIEKARAAGALTGQLPAVCRNCSQMYARAGCEEQAQAYSSLAETL